jgi:hypothetical protein
MNNSPALRCAFLVMLLWPVAGFAAAEWPEFRGPTADGHVTAGDLPLTWSESENVRWKTPIPHKGWSSPAIMDGNVWLTTATEEGNSFYVIAVDADTGDVLLNKEVFQAESPEPLSNVVNCYASPSPVVDAGQVYVHFGTYGTARLDAESGDIVWARNDMPCRHYRGPGSSPILHGELLILTFDGVDQQYVTALDKNTGDTVWRTDRTTEWDDYDENGNIKREGDFRKAYSTPILVTEGGATQVVSAGSSAAYGYDVKSGRELWKVRYPGFTASTRPVFGDGKAYVTSGRGGGELWAVKVDGRGDVTDSHVTWKVSDRAVVPQEPSPLLVDGLLYAMSNKGTATCLDAATGDVIWSERIGGQYMASPMLANGCIYFFSVQGKTTVIKTGRTFEVLATSELDDGFMASAAVTGDAFVLRTKTHLYRIEAGAKSAALR